ncbi:23812_t:CDS:2, partial [Cetraspora pellucida]
CAAGETCQNGTCVSPGCNSNAQCSNATSLCESILNAVCVNDNTYCDLTFTCNCCAPAPQTMLLAE